MFNKLKAIHNNSMLHLTLSFLTLVTICLILSSVLLNTFYGILPVESVESFKAKHVQNVLIFGFVGVASTFLALSLLLKFIVIPGIVEKEENKDLVSSISTNSLSEEYNKFVESEDKPPCFDNSPTKVELISVILFWSIVVSAIIYYV